MSGVRTWLASSLRCRMFPVGEGERTCETAAHGGARSGSRLWLDRARGFGAGLGPARAVFGAGGVMGNFFERLAGRALGVVPIAQPLIPPVTALDSSSAPVEAFIEV